MFEAILKDSLDFSSIQYQIDALAVKMFKLDCSSCGENFIRMADLRKHTLLQHYGGTMQQGVKRKSIFDGIEMDKRNSKEARRSFLLVFTCNFCPDKFTRYTPISFVYRLLSCCCHGVLTDQLAYHLQTWRLQETSNCS